SGPGARSFPTASWPVRTLSSPRSSATRPRATSSVGRRRCAGGWRRTTRCRRRSAWRAAPGRRRTCSPSPRLSPPRTRGTSAGPTPGASAQTRGRDHRAGARGRGSGAGAGPHRLHGPAAWAAVEGMARALEAAEGIARELGMHPFRITGQAKAIYHAGAVFASNYFVVVQAVAQRLLRHAGLTDADAWQALRPLVEGTLENLSHGQPMDALTGPVVRGDDSTIRRHLESLTKDDALLYRALGRAALELAEKRGMDEATAARVADALATDLPLVLRPGAGT